MEQQAPAGAGPLAARLFREALAGEEDRLEKLRQFDSEYSDLSDRLATITDKTRHNIMVPFGKVAFFPGQLVHTNEMTVHLGENYYAERSALQAGEIVQRRRAYLAEQIAAADSQISVMRARVGFAGEESEASGEDGSFEIREDYDEKVHGAPWERPKAAGDVGGSEAGGTGVGASMSGEEYDEVLDRLARLEAMEEEAEAAAAAVAPPAGPSGEQQAVGAQGALGGAGSIAPAPAGAFTGQIVERPVGGAGAPGAEPPSAPSDQPPRRMSKFRQERSR